MKRIPFLLLMILLCSGCAVLQGMQQAAPIKQEAPPTSTPCGTVITAKAVPLRRGMTRLDLQCGDERTKNICPGRCEVSRILLFYAPSPFGPYKKSLQLVGPINSPLPPLRAKPGMSMALLPFTPQGDPQKPVVVEDDQAESF